MRKTLLLAVGFTVCAFQTHCVFTELSSKEVFARHKATGKKATVYTCCSTYKPNTFTFSMPTEGVWYDFHVAGTEYGGYLRWTYDGWVKNLFHDTRSRLWPSSTYMVYPYGRSSVSVEKLVEGMQTYGKMRILHEEYIAESNTVKLPELEALQEKFNFDRRYTDDFPAIRNGQERLNAL